MVDSIASVLMARDNMTKQQAEELIEQAVADAKERLSAGEIPWDICEDWFGLEPDYSEELMYRSLI